MQRSCGERRFRVLVEVPSVIVHWCLIADEQLDEVCPCLSHRCICGAMYSKMRCCVVNNECNALASNSCKWFADEKRASNMGKAGKR